MRRVVVTGMGMLAPLGSSVEENFAALKEKRSGVRLMPSWEEIQGLRSRVAGAVEFTTPEHYTRKKIRGMGNVALYATYATEEALKAAKLLESPLLSTGRAGIAYGSCSGSPEALSHFMQLRTQKVLKGITSTTYIKSMSHTCAVNLSMFFKIVGRIIPTCSACTSATQAIGYGYENIKSGAQDIIIAGGAEELCPSIAGVFDVLFATSTQSEEPLVTPRPFDAERDGLVVGEGAATLVLEELEHAKARGATIFGEVVGFGTNADGQHVTNPDPEQMCRAMELAINDAGISPSEVCYVNAHATATELGDIAESKATNMLFGPQVAVSSLKSYMGHTLGACGAVESILTLKMLHSDWYAPTLHLQNVDERCADLHYVTGEGEQRQGEYVMNNNFAFGGVNASLVFKRWP